MNVLEQLAIEAEVIPANITENVDVHGTIGDVIEDNYTTPDASEMLQHADKARDIANQLDNLAERADELADEDERYSTLSVESLGREFATIMRAERLGYKAQSFESEVNNKAMAVGMARDARRVAADLRANANAMVSLSLEGGILDMFKSKDDLILRARMHLTNELNWFKGHTKELTDNPMVLPHDGISMFMSAKLKPVTKLDDQINYEVDYLNRLGVYVTDVERNIEAAVSGKTVSPIPMDSLVTKPDGLPIFRKGNDDYYPFMGNFGVCRVGDTLQLVGGFADIKKFFTPSALAKFVGAVVIGGKIPSVALAAATATGLGGVGTALVVGSSFVGSATIGHVTGQSMVNASSEIVALTPGNIVGAINSVLSLDKHFDSKSRYAELESVEQSLRDATLSPEVKKMLTIELSLAKSAIAILKTRTLYLTTNFATMVDKIQKKV